jgi:hypothetical protein
MSKMLRRIRLHEEGAGSGAKIEKEQRVMKYMLMMSGTKTDFEWYLQWSKPELQSHMAFMRALNNELREAGALVATEGLAFPHEAKLVRAAADATPITDGIFPESKEFLAGYWIVNLPCAEDAYRLAARISAAPGNKSRGNQPIEVREILQGAPEEWK